jgi:hypothetical protein
MQENELQRLILQAEELRRRYEIYFMGIEKREPGVLRERMEIQLRKCRLTHSFKTSTRFRYSQFMARYRTHCAHWDRVMRQIEEGSYRKGYLTEEERQAARQREFADKLTTGAMEELAVEIQDPSGDFLRITETANAAQRFLADMGVDAPTDTRASASSDALFKQYIEARKSQGEDVKKITRARFDRSLEKQRARAREELGVDIDFELKVKGSKVSLVARKKAPAAKKKKKQKK